MLGAPSQMSLARLNPSDNRYKVSISGELSSTHSLGIGFPALCGLVATSAVHGGVGLALLSQAHQNHPGRKTPVVFQPFPGDFFDLRRVLRSIRTSLASLPLSEGFISGLFAEGEDKVPRHELEGSTGRKTPVGPLLYLHHVVRAAL